MTKQLKYSQIDGMAAVKAVNATLRRIDERLIDHGERVAFIACEFCDFCKLNFNIKTLFVLSLFHDIGAYKTDEIDRMVEFESHDVQNHAIYGYLFLANMTPLEASAEAILYHHTAWSQLLKVSSPYKEYAALIHICDRVDIALHYENFEEYLQKIANAEDGLYCPDFQNRMAGFLRERKIVDKLKDGSYRKTNIERCNAFLPSTAESLSYLKMLVYSIDFRSEQTVTHTVNTTTIALDIATHFGLSEEQQEKIYIGALLHDIGKIAVPVSILEFPGKLNDEQMKIMRTHVVESRKLIEGIIPDEICRIATRHHEKFDGSGYPDGLTAKDLTFPERIVAVADIVSALSSRRSYKEPFPKEKVIAILDEMSGVKLDERICAYVCENYSTIMSASEPARKDIIAKYKIIVYNYKVACEELSITPGKLFD